MKRIISKASSFNPLFVTRDNHIMGAVSYFCCLFVMIIISQASAQTTYCDNSKGNYTFGSTYYNNLNTLLDNFTYLTGINYGFFNFSYGQVPDKVYIIALCRGDVKTEDCFICINNGRISLAQKCPRQKEAIIWREECMLRYTNRSILGIMENQPTDQNFNSLNVTGSVEQFSEALETLMRNLTAIAASGDSRRKYATGNTSTPNFQTIFGNVQCTPDLLSEDCTECLEEAISLIPKCCSGKAGGNVTKPSCRIRYDPYMFYGPTLELDPDSSQGQSNASRTIIAIAVPVASAVLVLILFCIYLRMRKQRKRTRFKREEDNYDDEIISAESLQFNFDTIRIATNEFADSNKLGQGGFGPVYRGQLSTGQEIAVKRMSRDSGQGDMEFKNEVLLVAKLQHLNLVTLLGFCLEGKERLLIYEFVPNKSLDYFIFDPTKKAQLDWERRQKIIGGIARGILYLHQDSRLRIIHRDLKASNVLLDEEMQPKISDFGMARLICMDQIVGNTKRVVGTYGYMAPEYVMYGQFSTKSDVFSFGVLLLEIVSGKKINVGIGHGENVEHLLSFAWRNWREGTTTNIVDPTLNDGSENEIKRCIHIGLLCVQENVVARPTMTSVVLMLSSYSFILPVPSEPAFVVDNKTRSFPDMSSSANKSITELYPR